MFNTNFGRLNDNKPFHPA